MNDSPNPAAQPQTDVALAAVARDASEDDLTRAVKEAARAATDFSWLSKGDTVVIKPVQNSGGKYPTTTNPIGVKAMAELLRERGAGRVIVTDMAGYGHVVLFKWGRVWGSTRRLMKRSKTAQAAEAGGAELYFAEEEGWDAFYEETPRSGEHWSGAITMPKVLKEADHIVLMPRCGRHMMAGNTLGLKAAVGWWRTDSRIEMHLNMALIQEMIAEANTVPALLDKQRLTLTVADKVLAAFGPDNGYVHQPETGLVIASESVVAHDMISLAWLIEAREQAPAKYSTSMIRDPNSSQTALNLVSRGLALTLGGPLRAITTDTMQRNDLNSINDCRILRRGFEVLGGRPAVNLVSENGGPPAEIITKLERHARA